MVFYIYKFHCTIENYSFFSRWLSIKKACNFVKQSLLYYSFLHCRDLGNNRLRTVLPETVLELDQLVVLDTRGNQQFTDIPLAANLLNASEIYTDRGSTCCIYEKALVHDGGTVKPVLRDHCHETTCLERPDILVRKSYISMQFNLSPKTPILRDHICMANGVVFQDRFYCMPYLYS